MKTTAQKNQKIKGYMREREGGNMSGIEQE